MAYDAATQRDAPLSDAALSQLFTEARTRNAWSDRPVAPELLHKLYDLTKFGPTAVNASPARFVFVTSPEAKARLIPLMSEGNRAKTLQAPVTVIIGQDIDFHEQLPKLFPHAPGAKDWFADEAGRRESAFRNASLQGGYFLLAARALGYVPNKIAGALASQRVNLVGVIIPSMSNMVFPEVMTGISETLEDTGLQPVVGITNYQPEREESVLYEMLSWRPSGLIIAGLEHSPAASAISTGCSGVQVCKMARPGRSARPARPVA